MDVVLRPWTLATLRCRDGARRGFADQAEGGGGRGGRKGGESASFRGAIGYGVACVCEAHLIPHTHGTYSSIRSVPGEQIFSGDDYE